METELSVVHQIEECIFIIRGKKVMLDRDLAKLYGVPTKRLNEQVKRNPQRFPHDFMFVLTRNEFDELVANCDHLIELKFSHSLPYAFTEQGVAMLSSVLNRHPSSPSRQLGFIHENPRKKSPAKPNHQKGMFMKKMYMTVLDREKLGKDYYRSYGPDAQITRLGRVNLIHLDNPSPDELKRRIEDAAREPICNCAICRDYARHPLDIIYTNIEIPGLATFN